MYILFEKSIYYFYIYNTQSLCVWPAIHFAPGGHTYSRPVSLEPVWPEGGHRTKILSKNDQWRNYRRQKLSHQCFSLEKNFTVFWIYIQNANITNVLPQYTGSVIIFVSGYIQPKLLQMEEIRFHIWILREKIL
jgi:hypothetical protein